MSRDGHLRATFSKPSETWRVVTERRSIVSDTWQYIEVSWHPEKGVYVHIDKQWRASDQSYTNVSESDVRIQNQTSTVYLGSSDSATPPQYFHVLVDELGIWFADRDHVKAFGFLEDGE